MKTESSNSQEMPPEQNEQDWTKSCPICFVEHVPLAQSTSCGHAFCIECLEQFFSLPASSSTVQDIENNDENETDSQARSSLALDVSNLKDLALDNIATIGRCPLCRLPLSLLDMKHVSTQRLVWGSSRVYDLGRTPLAGKAYATRKGAGFNSFHFPTTKNTTENDEDSGNTDDSESEHPSRPFFLWQEDKSLFLETSAEAPESTEEVDRKRQTRYFFEPGYFYFAPKRTFHGRLALTDGFGTPQPADILLSFAANHKWITGGVLIRYRNPQEVRYPLEGKWQVTWYKEALPPGADALDESYDNLIIARDHIRVVNNYIRDSASIQYCLRYDSDRVYFHWPGMGVTQALEQESEFRNNSDDNNTGIPIPPVGTILKWRTTEPNQPFIVWKRESIGEASSSPVAAVEYFGNSGSNSDRQQFPSFYLRRSQTWYREVIGDMAPAVRNDRSMNDDGRPNYHADQLWGNTFCQGLRVGLASYHFRRHPPAEEGQEGEPYAYISYENPHTAQWPPLDDGSPIPSQVSFHGISVAWEEEPEHSGIRYVVFRGNIEWLQDYGTTWQNHKRWEYEMHFDSELTCIIGGSVHCVTADGDDRQEMSSYGTDLIYINAGIMQAIDSWMTNPADGGRGEHDEEEHDPNLPRSQSETYRRYNRLSRQLRHRLQSEGASVRTVAMVNMVLTMSQQPEAESPIDYNVLT